MIAISATWPEPRLMYAPARILSRPLPMREGFDLCSVIACLVGRIARSIAPHEKAPAESEYVHANDKPE